MEDLKKEGQKIRSYIPKMEYLEKDLELLDQNGHDEELSGLVSNVENLVTKSKSDLKTK
jgi:hypothetical protein